MSQESYQIQFEETIRSNFTQIPNILSEMLELNLISLSDFMLYFTYRKIAGEEGCCFYGTRSLAKKCKLSQPSITKSKSNLSKPFEILGGKSLIKIIPCNRKESNKGDTVLILDIWNENKQYYNTKKTCAKPEPVEGGGVQNENTGVCKMKIQIKNESKRSYRSNSLCGNVHNSAKSPQSKPESKKKPPDISINSIPLNKKNNSIPSDYSKKSNIDDLESDDLLELISLESVYTKYFTPDKVAKWCKRYGLNLVVRTLKFFLETCCKPNSKPIKKPEAWVGAALEKRTVDINLAANRNKSFAKELKKRYNLDQLKISDRYCLDENKQKDLYYNLPEQEFKRILLRFYNIKE